MIKSSSFMKTAGVVLIILILASATLAIGGIWGFIRGDTASQLFGTFLVVGGAVIGVSYAVTAFINKGVKDV